jgi:hypothetical protein
VRPTFWLLLVLATPPACKPGGKQAAGAPAMNPNAFEKKFFVPKGLFAEVNLQMPAGSEALADYVVEDGGSIEWNVHSHKNEETVVHDEGDGAKGNLAFRAPEDGVYSYLWENKKGKRPVVLKVKLTLSGGARVHSVTPEK